MNDPGTALNDLYTPQWETIDATAAVATVAASPALPKVPTAVLSKGEPFEVTADFPKDLVGRLEQDWPLAQQSSSRRARTRRIPSRPAVGTTCTSRRPTTSATSRRVLARRRRPTSPTTTG